MVLENYSTWTYLSYKNTKSLGLKKKNYDDWHFYYEIPQLTNSVSVVILDCP